MDVRAVGDFIHDELIRFGWIGLPSGKVGATSRFQEIEHRMLYKQKHRQSIDSSDSTAYCKRCNGDISPNPKKIHDD